MEIMMTLRRDRIALSYGSILRMAFFLGCWFVPALATAEASRSNFRIIALAEKGGIHKPFVDAAKVWLNREGAADGFSVDYIETTDTINEQLLSHYQLFLQLNYAPYAWSPAAMAAFQKAIDQGTIGWVGFHHATLLGEFDGYPMWPWFSTFMGGIRWKSYISTFSSAQVVIEDPSHPAMKGLAPSFRIDDEEWYTYDKSPRANVRVLASVKEETYSPTSKIVMGDHPVIWTNPRVKARNIYIFMGHHPELFNNPAYSTLVRGSILWAAGR
jgi:type 1 glutamine amidotransferase